MSVDELLEIVKRTNPNMTKEQLVYKLEQCQYSSRALIHTEECCKPKNLYGKKITPGVAL